MPIQTFVNIMCICPKCNQDMGIDPSIRQMSDALIDNCQKNLAISCPYCNTVSKYTLLVTKSVVLNLLPLVK